MDEKPLELSELKEAPSKENPSHDRPSKEETLRVCRRCLLYTEDREEFFRKLEIYIAHLDEEDRAEQAVYEERLSQCARCEYLLDGMCRLCGCYVELRAALRVRRCPDVTRRW